MAAQSDPATPALVTGDPPAAYADAMTIGVVTPATSAANAAGLDRF